MTPRRIAQAFLVAPAAMAQRLVRAKAKIRLARIGFAEPRPDELPERLDAVLGAIYAAFGTAWDAVPGTEAPPGSALADEAIHLARLVAALAPDQAEPRGLLALLLFCAARAPARRDAAGGFVPLADQDWQLWSQPEIAEAEGPAARRPDGRAGPVPDRGGDPIAACPGRGQRYSAAARAGAAL